MKHPDYTSRTVSNAPHPKKVEVTFNSSIVAETTRALLLTEGYTPAEIGITATNEQEMRAQAQNKVLVLNDKNATDFNFFYKNAHKFAQDFEKYALDRDVELARPTVEFDDSRRPPHEKIYPAMRIFRLPVKNANAGKEFVQQLNDQDIPIHLTDRGRKIDIEPDRVQGIDFVQPLRKLLGSDRNLDTLRRQGPRQRGED